jgi:2-phosphoglycerate kinase
VEDNKLYVRLDLAIERLTDISHEIKQVLVVHETKLEQQDELNRQYYDQIDKLHIRVGNLRDELMKKMESIEKWRWVLLGGAMALGLVVGNSEVAKLFAG